MLGIGWLAGRYYVREARRLAITVRTIPIRERKEILHILSARMREATQYEPVGGLVLQEAVREVLIEAIRERQMAVAHGARGFDEPSWCTPALVETWAGAFYGSLQGRISQKAFDRVDTVFCNLIAETLTPEEMFEPIGDLAKEGAGAAALQLLDRAIQAVHPDRFLDSIDAAGEIQPRLATINTILGRDEQERFFRIDYERLVSRMIDLENRGRTQVLLHHLDGCLVETALLTGALHEGLIRIRNESYDDVNLGREVQASTLTLIDFLNRAASTRREPMP